MSRQSRELKKQQERAKKYGCDGRCYWSTGMCPSVEICDETRVGEAIATAMGVTMVLRMIDAQNEPKQPTQPQINLMAALFGAMMQQAAKNQQEEGNPEGSEIESDDDE